MRHQQQQSNILCFSKQVKVNLVELEFEN